MKLKTVAVFMFLGLSVSGCDYIPTAKNQALKAVKESLIDPSSAKFSDVFEGVKEGSYCGFVNGKNRMGAYAGKNYFIYDRITRGLGLTYLASGPLTDSDFRALQNSGGDDYFTKYYTEIVDGCGFTDNWKTVCGGGLPFPEHRLCSEYREGNIMEAINKEFPY